MSEKDFVSRQQKVDHSCNSQNAIRSTYKEQRECTRNEDFDLLMKNIENLQWANKSQKHIVLEHIEKSFKRAEQSSKVANRQVLLIFLYYYFMIFVLCNNIIPSHISSLSI
ncbi:hypothetical protein Wxf_00046 [Armadillidium vulgare]|nr:hypothetical protein Wxf_00046 [Armadillidium vulgare] [Wolbachia endosymbiont of Armadillidium vulgare]